MRFSTRTIVLIACCGCMAFVAISVVLPGLLYLVATQSSSGAAIPRSSIRFSTVAPVPVVQRGNAAPALASATPFARQQPTESSPAQENSMRTVVSIEQYIAAERTANLRACPRTNCVIVRVLNRGEAITTVGEVVGDNVQGNSNWTRVLPDGQETFVHSALVSRTRPQPLQNLQGQSGQVNQVQPTSDSRNACPGMSCADIRERYGDGNFTPGHPTNNGNRDGAGIACETGS